MPPLPKRPVDELRSMAAPGELIDWVRKLPPEDVARRAWVDATRADWVAYLAVLRGIQREVILRAACTCALEFAERSLTGAEGERILAVLRDASERGRDGLATAEAQLDDLRLAMIGRDQTASDGAAEPKWMFWCKLVLELARGSSRGNALPAIALGMKMLAAPGHGVRPSDLVARFREKLTLAS